MAAVAAIGDALLLGGFALAGVPVHDAPEAAAARAAWDALPHDVGLLVLDPAAYDALAARLPERAELVWVVTPR